jgi:serine/threonine protein kinase/Tol biopolymer transport system component
MTISAGTRLGPYEVVAPLGAGGMGEVWRARDTRLDRSVAIKLLPAEFATNAQFRLRLEREAKTISQLNHPHICTLYDVGHENGRDYLVMEYLEGETLADRIDRGPLPLEDVIRYGIEIASALERAHAAGIIHRDLKPGNVMLTKSGTKLLDFGLAKTSVAGGALTGSVAGEAPAATLHKPLTQEGTILGTFQYMAPEQLEGQEADLRTDIFALGTILYEMATGRRAFQGKTRTSLIAAIVDRDPPPISSVQPLTPRAFERVVMTCLAKDPNDRWQSAHDVRLELEWLAEAETELIAPRKRSRIAWTVAAVLALLAIASTAMLIRSMLAARNQPPVRTSILPPSGGNFESFIDGGPPAISPDGKKVVFAAGLGGTRTLWVRTIDSPIPRQLSGTEGAGHPFWSPDSRYIAFYADASLKKIHFAGGAPVVICTSDPYRGGDWNRDGTILIGYSGSGILKVSSGGGTPIEVTSLDQTQRDTTHRFPSFLPDGKHFLFLAGPHPGDETADVICVGSLEKKMRKPLIHATSNAAYYEGWILFVRDQILMAQKFDTKKLEISGDPIALPEQRIEFDAITGRAFFSVAANGTLLYETGEGIRQTQLTWIERSGKAVGTAGEAQSYGQVALSNDGRYVAYSLLPRQSIWMYDVARGIKTRITNTKSRDYAPVWSPDGTKIVFSSNRGGRAYDLYLKDMRTGAEELLLASDKDKTPTSWSRDGQYIFYNLANLGPNKIDIGYFSFADHKPHVYLATPFLEVSARFSPDGKWVAYNSTESPPTQVYVAPFPPTGAKWQVSSRAGGAPHWRADGKELYYYMTGKIVAVPIKLSTTPEIGQATPLFDVHFGLSLSWDVAADGQKFLVNSRGGETAAPAPLTLVQHFDAELRQAEEKRD